MNTTLPNSTTTNSQPDGQNSRTVPAGAGVGDGTGAAPGRDVGETVGWGGFVLVLVTALVGRIGSVPVTETK